MIDETVAEIEEMQTHSSSEVAIKAARALETLTEREFATVEEFERSLRRNSNALRSANPSHATLQTTQQDILDGVMNATETVPAAKDRLSEVIKTTIESVEGAKDAAAEAALELLSDGDTILTHDYSSTVLRAIEHGLARGDSYTVFVTEARPRFIGRKTARALAEMDGVDAHLIVDSAAGHYLRHVDRILVGMDCIVSDTLYNRVGTFPLAATAAHLEVPLTVVGASSKIVETGFVFENDFRVPSEVLPEPAEGFTIENPAYDATPTTLVDSVATDEGILETFD